MPVISGLTVSTVSGVDVAATRVLPCTSTTVSLMVTVRLSTLSCVAVTEKVADKLSPATDTLPASNAPPLTVMSPSTISIIGSEKRTV